jgi:hypothetical protein
LFADDRKGFQLAADIGGNEVDRMRPAKECLHDRPGHGWAAGLFIERPCSSPLGQHARRDVLQKDDVPAVRVVPKSTEETLGFGGILDSPLRPDPPCRVPVRIDCDVVGRFGLFNSQGFKLEFVFELARGLGGNLPGACPGRRACGSCPSAARGGICTADAGRRASLYSAGTSPSAGHKQ